MTRIPNLENLPPPSPPPPPPPPLLSSPRSVAECGVGKQIIPKHAMHWPTRCLLPKRCLHINRFR